MSTKCIAQIHRFYIEPSTQYVLNLSDYGARITGPNVAHTYYWINKPKILAVTSTGINMKLIDSTLYYGADRFDSIWNSNYTIVRFKVKNYDSIVYKYSKDPKTSKPSKDNKPQTYFIETRYKNNNVETMVLKTIKVSATNEKRIETDSVIKTYSDQGLLVTYQNFRSKNQEVLLRSYYYDEKGKLRSTLSNWGYAASFCTCWPLLCQIKYYWKTNINKDDKNTDYENPKLFHRSVDRIDFR